MSQDANQHGHQRKEDSDSGGVNSDINNYHNEDENPRCSNNDNKDESITREQDNYAEYEIGCENYCQKQSCFLINEYKTNSVYAIKFET